MDVACYKCGASANRSDNSKRGVLCKGCKSKSWKQLYKRKRKDIIRNVSMWASKNRDRINSGARSRYLLKKEASVAAYGGRCSCGESRLEFLVIDHIDDNGAADRNFWRNKVSDIHTWLKRNGYPHGYQVLCGSCNLKKEIQRRRIKQSPSWNRSQEAKIKVLSAYGGFCSCCREEDQDKLVMDHILGGGSAEKEFYPSRNIYFFLEDKPVDREKFQVLCHNCNQAKESFGCCPHPG